MPSTMAGCCAAVQDKFWELHDALFDRSDCIVYKGPEEIARKLEIDVAELRIRRYAKWCDDDIKSNMELAKSLIVTATPTFVLGRVVIGQLTGERIAGALPLDEFVKKLDAASNQK